MTARGSALVHDPGAEIVLATFAGSAKAREIRDGDRVALTIDSDRYPYEWLRLRGMVTVTAHDGPVVEYRAAAHRHLGPAAAGFLAELEGRAMLRIAVRTTHATSSPPRS